MRRPTVMAACAFALGIAAAYQLKFNSIVLLAACAAVVFMWFMKAPRIAVLFLCFLTAGSGIFVFADSRTEPLEKYCGGSTEISGTIRHMTEKEDRVRLEIAEKRGSRVLLSVYGKDIPKFEEGQNVTAFCEISLPSPARNPGCFDYRMYLKTRKVNITATASDYQIRTGRITSKLRKRIWSIRQEFHQRLEDHMSKDDLAMVEAMMFGDKSGLDEELYESFQKNGTAHILAVSGLHIGMIYALISSVIGGRRRVFPNIVILVLLIIYAAMAGFAPSVVRAVIMIALHIISRLIHYRYDLMSAGCFTAMTILAANPYQLFGLGFQLSFLAIFTMAVFLPVFEYIPLHPVFKNVFLPVLVIQAGMAPYSAYVFNYFSLGAFIANIPVIFLAGIVVPAGVAAIAATGSIPELSGIFSGFLEIGIKGISVCNNIFYANGATSFEVTSPPLILILIYYGLFFFLLSEMARILIIRGDWEKVICGLVAVGLLVCFFYSGWANEFKKAEIVFLDVGQGSAIHLRSPSGYNISIDGGGKKDFNTGKKILKPYCLKNGVKKVDLALATHKDTDHYKGLTELEELGMIEKMITNDDGYKAGDVIFSEDGFRIEAAAPLEEAGAEASAAASDTAADESENERSLVFKVTVGDYSILATGDIGEETEKAVAGHWEGSGFLETDILLAPHHGSRFSSSKELIAAASPGIAVIQVGKNNYGHPSEEALDRYRKAGIPVYRNDRQGAVGIFRGCRVRTMLQKPSDTAK